MSRNVFLILLLRTSHREMSRTAYTTLQSRHISQENVETKNCLLRQNVKL